MAKKVKESCCAPMAAPHPRMYVSLEGQDVSQLKSLTVGDKVELRVTGTVVGLSQRERTDYEDSKKKVKTGDIDLEKYRVEVMEGDEKKAEDNVFTKMSHEDD